MSSAVGQGPLAGISVIEAASYMSGPYAALQLADLGAQVIKVEPAGGDPFRNFGRPSTYVSAHWASMNRGKRSVTLDLKIPAGLRRMLQLLRSADVFITNWRPGVGDALGLSDQVIETMNPRLIRLYITGFGVDGPSAKEAAFDTAVQARSGMMDAVSPDGTPRALAGYPVDKLTAIMGAQAVLAALYERERSGIGDRIDLAMLDVAAATSFPDLFPSRVFIQQQPQDPHNLQSLGIRPLPASDGFLVVAPGNGSQIKRACHAVDHPEFISEIFSETDQATLVQVFFDLLAGVTIKDTVEAWLARFRTHDVPSAACVTMDAHFDDPQVLHNGLYRTGTWEETGLARYVRYPAVFRRWGHLVAHARPPRLGEHTEVMG